MFSFVTYVGIEISFAAGTFNWEKIYNNKLVVHIEYFAVSTLYFLKVLASNTSSSWFKPYVDYIFCDYLSLTEV